MKAKCQRSILFLLAHHFYLLNQRFSTTITPSVFFHKQPKTLQFGQINRSILL